MSTSGPELPLAPHDAQPAPVGEDSATQPAVHLLGMTPPELGALDVLSGEPAFRVQQIFEWVYQRGVASFDEMTNLSKSLRARLASQIAIYSSRVANTAVAADETRKLLLTFPDGESAETVWIPADDRETACLSSQVGCPVGCRFCASGLDGVVRNLTAGEIVEQALRVRQLIAQARPGVRLSNLVLMGMGEPLANYAHVIRAIRILNAPWGGGIGARKITLSTVGLPAQIRRLADEDLQLNLALSLHAPDDALRRELVPWGKGVAIKALLDACRYYFEKTGREITLEYVLLDEVNMQPEHAEKLAAIAKQIRANVNLLRFNPVPGVPYSRPSAETAEEFQRRLRRHGVTSHLRRSRGSDAAAACGQLRRQARAE
ncbi:MAG: 23S rRNA (adenine(2503)-C(2))-methyltransferase RlmN [Phycisphaerae bacterium]